MQNNITSTTSIQRELDRAEAERRHQAGASFAKSGYDRQPTTAAVEQLAKLRDVLKRLAAQADEAPGG
jgi:hypothetical protein